MRKAVILHGTDANPEANWFPWLKQKLESEGYDVWVPELPGNHAPDREVYGDFLFDSDWDFRDNIVIGHSSGAVEVLNMLMDDRCPQVKLAVCVSAWDHGTPAGMDVFQFENLFPKDGFDFEKIVDKSGTIEFFHGDDDPYCPIDQARYLAKNTGAGLTIIPSGKHLGENFVESHELWHVIQDKGLN